MLDGELCAGAGRLADFAALSGRLAGKPRPGSVRVSKKGRRQGQRQGPRVAKAGEQVAVCGLPQRCRARELLHSLTVDELRVALDRAKEPGRSALYRGMGWDRRNKAVPAMLKARLAHMDPHGLHTVMQILGAAPLGALAAMFG
ncbi:MAG TPA: hypothetical protein VGW38_12230, partial [Chloroflexota bacterium]|nr:hypothetical protein [Chloroflexota bacterium]